MPDILFRQRFFLIALFSVLTSLLFAPGAQAQPCDPEASAWIKDKSYTQGSVVFYKDHWYEARDLNVDGEPGITFHWRALNEVPQCDKKAEEKREKNAPKVAAPGSGEGTQPGADTGSGKTSESASGLCITPEPWRFLHPYKADELATHGGKVWQAIHPTKGDMPGTVEPPSWQLVPDHCSMKTNAPFRE